MIRYSVADDVKALVEDIVAKLPEYFGHIRVDRIICLRSMGSRSSAVARIHGLPSIWRYALGIEPLYIIEVISKRYDSLSYSGKVKVLIHELLHIPAKFSGGLRPHGKYVNSRIVSRLYKIYIARARR